MKKISFITSLVLVLTNSCNEIVEPDISDKEIVLIAPGDSVMSDSSRVTFFWEDLGIPVDYNLQIVSGSFDAPDFLILDTLLTTTKVPIYLDSGVYHWGVRALNAHYETDFFVRTLTITKNKFSLGEIRLIFPQQDQVLTDTTFQFSWQPVNGIDAYLVKITPGFNAAEDLIGTKNSFLVRTFRRENREYQWQVLGVNENENTAISSEVYSFSIQQ